MFKVSVCYGQPTDPVAFDDYYSTVHTPLALKIPGLTRFTVGKCQSLDRSDPPFYMVASLSSTPRIFETRPHIAGNEEAGADVANFATGGATLYSQREDVLLG